MGSSKIGGLPREIATFLGLSEPEQYRTSATLLADSGADLTARHGVWKSSSMAEGYIEDSIENKSKICKGIIESIKLKQSSPDPWTLPSTSKDSLVENRSKRPANPPQSPTFTMQSYDNEPCSAHLSSNTQVTNTSITDPKKNVIVNITNCSNFTFNF